MTKYEYQFKGHSDNLREGTIIRLDHIDYVILGFYEKYKGNDNSLSIFVYYIEESNYLKGIDKRDIQVIRLTNLKKYKIQGYKEEREVKLWLMKLKLMNVLEVELETREELRVRNKEYDIKFRYECIVDIYLFSSIILFFLIIVLFLLALVYMGFSKIASISIVVCYIIYVIKHIISKEYDIVINKRLT